MLLPLDEILFDEEPHTYTYRGKVYCSVTQVIQLAGLGPNFDAVPLDRLEYARHRGNMVHKACHYMNDGGLDWSSIHESLRGYVEAYALFLTDKHIKVVAAETRLVEPTTLQLAGTPDLVCFVDGHRCVIDLKTSQMLHRSMGLQTVGYSFLWNQTHPKEPIRERYGLRLESTGRYRLIVHDNPSDPVAFMDALYHAFSEQKMQKWREVYG